MTDLNDQLDPAERDAMAWRMLEERLDMYRVDLSKLKNNASVLTALAVVSAVHDALAYRRQS